MDKRIAGESQRRFIRLNHWIESHFLLSGADFLSAYRNGQRNFHQITLQGVNLTHAKLPQVNFQGSNLSHACLRRSCLHRSSFRNCILKFARLEGADLSACDFRGSDLSGANLTGAYLRGTDLRAVNLRGACLQGCYVDQSTCFDENFDPQQTALQYLE